MPGGSKQCDDLIKLHFAADCVGLPGSRKQGVESLAEPGESAVHAHVGPGCGEEVDHCAGAGRVFDDVGEEFEQGGRVALAASALASAASRLCRAIMIAASRSSSVGKCRKTVPMATPARRTTSSVDADMPCSSKTSVAGGQDAGSVAASVGARRGGSDTADPKLLTT